MTIVTATRIGIYNKYLSMACQNTIHCGHKSNIYINNHKKSQLDVLVSFWEKKKKRVSFDSHRQLEMTKRCIALHWHPGDPSLHMSRLRVLLTAPLGASLIQSWVKPQSLYRHFPGRLVSLTVLLLLSSTSSSCSGTTLSPVSL